MKIELIHNKIVIGEIFPTFGSRITKEVKGLLVPTNEYYKIYYKILKYNEIFDNPKANNIIDKFLNKQLEIKYIYLKNWFSEFKITLDEITITDCNSKIIITDNLTKTGLGNSEISIQAWNLKTDIVSKDFKVYSIKYEYPSEPPYIITIKDKGEIILKY